MPEQAHIHVLSDHVANKIAAGEVVDRPASVLKELVENALDAGATQIDVEIAAGGRKAIVVSDNGRGMGRDDVLLSIERHATSKIRDVEDIERIGTLGFRGEALAAISSVSRFTLFSRPADAEGGTELAMAGGKIVEVREAGGPVGTTVAVRNLFHNVPARRRFLRSEQTEVAHLRQVFLLYALSRPATGMKLVVDDREVHRLAPASTLDIRLRELFGPEIHNGLRPVQLRTPEISITGYAGLPQAHRADRSEQYVFINSRPAGAPVVAYALNEAYHGLIPKGRHPMVFLFIDLPPEDVDVNVHPTKRDVRFRNASAVRDALLAAIRGAIGLDAAAAASGATPIQEFLQSSKAAPVLTIPDLPSLPPFSYPRATLDVPEPSTSSGLSVTPTGDVRPSTLDPRTSVAVPEPSTPGATSPWTWCRVLGQVGGLYVILETEDGVILMDPHAAHERVLYERFMAEVVRHRVKAQGLLAPESVELTPARALTVRNNTGLLKDMGFGLSDFGGDAFLVDALPVCLGNVSARAVLSEIADTLEHGGVRGGAERWAEEQIALAACKAAVKANDRLTLQEIEALVVDLARSEMPYTCPHGRPTTIFMSFQDLRRKFGRE
jgi:DNA mismatch repair protein MutL